MNDIVSRNTIQLAASASGVSNYYVGYTLILKRYNNVTGKELEQRKQIVAYNGSSKIATIDGIWDADFIPAETDTYQIIPTYGDKRVSINPVIQTLDYITSKRYGKGLDPNKDLRLTSWMESARICDTQSDVTIEVEGSTAAVEIGAVYKWQPAVALIWQGKVKSKTATHVTFTAVLGKLAFKWNSWRSFKIGDLVYNSRSQLFRVAAAGTLTFEPTVTTGTVVLLSNAALTKVSGGGPTSISFKVNGNPVRSLNKSGIPISGYSLYDSDGIDYWRYMGWDGHDQRYVTRHQTNLVVDTSVTVFDNINSFLEHFGGILRYTEGKYDLEVEQGEGAIPNTELDPRNITSDDIIGKIRLSDDGIRSSFNSLAVAYADPANKFEAKNISFFNSDFLKSDRNVPKKGNVAIPGITNYYNARLLADKFLVKSRYGLSISFNMTPKGALLLAGKVIQIQNDRYGWENKRFRIENITHNNDTSVDIVAKEYDDDFYVISNVSRAPASATGGDPNTVTSIQPGGLTATGLASQTEKVGGIELNWAPIPTPDPTVSTEIYSGPTAVLQATVTSAGGPYVTITPAEMVYNGAVLTAWETVPGLITKGEEYKVILPEGEHRPILGGLPTLPSTVAYKFLTASLLATVESTSTSYIDVITFPELPLEPITSTIPPEIDPENPPEEPEEPEEPTEPEIREDRIEKFYWIRHKIVQQ